MNRETEQFFAEIPEMNRPRSKFKIPFRHRTTFNAGKLIPAYWTEILPGDTVKMKMSSVIRMSTPLYPTMDNTVVDHLFFFVPTRLLWNHWVNFWGENPNAWYQNIEYEVPQIKTYGLSVFKEKSIADYMGLQCNMEGLSVSALPFRGLVKIWNDWFRDENLQQEATLTLGDTTEYAGTESRLGGDLLPANKLMDYFTAALPAPAKGNEVLLPLGNLAPVYSLSQAVPTKNVFGTYTRQTERFTYTGSNLLEGSKIYGIAGTANSGGTGISTLTAGKELSADDVNGTTLMPNNLWTDLSAATASTVNELRQAFAIQRFFEAQARGGSRYIEFLKNIFGVTSPDARLQRSEYLGGKRIPFNIYQVNQQSATDENSPLGTTGGFGHMSDKDDYFTKSFTEHGYLYGITIIRIHKHTYQQGIERAWSRKKFTDYYLPQFANLGEQEIKVKEIYATGTSADEEVFGYQERYAEYRYKPNIVTAEMKSSYTTSLDPWHYADDYESQPILGETWIKEDSSIIDRTLAVSENTADQFIADLAYDPTFVRCMPLFGVPGLIDHF